MCETMIQDRLTINVAGFVHRKAKLNVTHASLPENKSYYIHDNIVISQLAVQKSFRKVNIALIQSV